MNLSDAAVTEVVHTMERHRIQAGARRGAHFEPRHSVRALARLARATETVATNFSGRSLTCHGGITRAVEPGRRLILRIARDRIVEVDDHRRYARQAMVVAAENVPWSACIITLSGFTVSGMMFSRRTPAPLCGRAEGRDRPTPLRACLAGLAVSGETGTEGAGQ